MSADGGFTAGSTTPSGRWPARSTRSWRAGCSTTGGSTRRRCIASWRASTPTWCAGSATSTDGTTRPAPPAGSSRRSPPGIRASSGTGAGSRPPGEQGDKSPVTGDCHAGICGSRRVKLPPATRPWLTVGSDVDRSSAGSSTSTNEPRPETAGHMPRPGSGTGQDHAGLPSALKQQVSGVSRVSGTHRAGDIDGSRRGWVARRGGRWASEVDTARTVVAPGGSPPPARSGPPASAQPRQPALTRPQRHPPTRPPPRRSEAKPH